VLPNSAKDLRARLSSTFTINVFVIYHKYDQFCSLISLLCTSIKRYMNVKDVDGKMINQEESTRELRSKICRLVFGFDHARSEIV
jgi:hypothetical protein